MPDGEAYLLGLFEVEEDLASSLQDLSAEALSSFILCREDVSDEGLNKATSYAFFLLFQKTGSVDYLHEGIAVAEEWLHHSENSCPRLILDMLRKQLDKAKCRAEAEPSENSNIVHQSQIRPPHELDHTIRELECRWSSEPVYNQGPTLTKLGSYLDDRYKATDWLEDLNNAIKYAEMAACLPCDKSTLSLRLTNLGSYYGSRAERLGSTEDIDCAVKLTKMAIDLEPEDPLCLARSFSGLDIWMSWRFDRFRDDEDLREAVQAAEMAVALTPDDNPSLHGRLNNLSNRLSTRFDQYTSKDDLLKAIELLERALDWKYGLSNHDKAMYFSNLGSRLHDRFKNNLLMDDLNRAIEVAEQAVALSLSEVDLSAPSYLNNLAILFNERFEQRGVLQDLDDAIERAAMAVARSPRGHPDIVVRIMNWGCWLRSRAEHTGSLDDVDRSIDVIRPTLDSLPSDHALRAALLNELSNSYAVRYDRSSITANLELGLDYAKEAFEFEPRDRLRWTSILNNYANLLGSHSRVTDSSESHSKAIEIMRLAIKDTPTGHSYLPSRLCNLGDLLGWQFRKTGSRQDIDNAITATEEALNTLPLEHLSRARYMVNLGTWLGERFKSFGGKDDQRRLISIYEEGSEITTATPSVRVMLARRAGSIHASSLAWKESCNFLEKAVDLLPAVSLRSLKHTDKQDMLAEFFGLASDSAAISLNAGNSPYHALQLLERGRGVIASMLMDLRGNTSDLQRDHPDLAKKFLALRDQLASEVNVSGPLTSIDHVASWDSKIRQRRAADEDLNKLIQTIRDQPGFQDFLLLPSEEELLEAAKPGPIVVINTSRYRCDAFLIQEQKLSVLNLSHLKAGDVEEQVRNLRSIHSSNHAGMKDLLNWLWDKITGPCLDALEYRGPTTSSDTLPRVWWVPTGLSSQLPLHAAGDYRGQSFDSVLDRVMSSYSVSVKSLIHGRTDVSSRADKHSHNGVLISMKHTPHLPHTGDLDFAEDEIRMLEDMCAPLGLFPVIPKPLKDEVLKFLKGCSVFHFAGHGKLDPTEPSRSCLLLDDWKTDPLTVGDFRDYHLYETPPFLGYLSACSTGVNSVVALADEGIHLISSLQLAGFRHVVGTLWEVSDRHCVNIARVFYETLQVEGLTDIGVCRALHRAVKVLRDGQSFDAESARWAFCLDPGSSMKFTEGVGNFYWVPYVHFGS